MKISEIEAKLESQGHRPTSARHDVIEALIHSEGHLTADELYDQMRSSGSKVGRMTVFRTLDLLAEIGVVRPTYQGSGAAHFVLLEEGLHHHLVCMQCSTTVEFLDCSLADDLSQQLADRFNFKIEGHLLEIYGLCESCQG